MTQANEKTPLVASSSASESKDSVVNGKPRFSLSHSMSVFAAEHMGKIGMLGSMSIAVNSLTGPAMLTLPDQYQRSGLIPTTLTVIFVCILSALCCLHMANTISKVRGNADFKREVCKECVLFWSLSTDYANVTFSSILSHSRTYSLDRIQ